MGVWSLALSYRVPSRNRRFSLVVQEIHKPLSIGLFWRIYINKMALPSCSLLPLSLVPVSVLRSLDEKKALWSQCSCAGHSHRSKKSDSLSFLWSHPSSPWNLFTQVLLPSFSHLSRKFCSGSLSKWNRIAFLNPNKPLHSLVYLVSV